MTFTGGAGDHQHAHSEKSRKFFTSRINQPPWPTRNSFHQILLHKKERLDATHLSGQIAQNQVLIFEIIGQCFLNDFVEAMVCAPVVKSVGPVLILPKLIGRDDGSSAVLKRKRRHSHAPSATARSGVFSDGVISTRASPSRKWRSRCGYGISMPASRNFCTMAKFKSLRNRRGRYIISLLHTTNSRLIELSPNVSKNTVGSGWGSTCEFSRATSTKAFRTFSRSLP